MEQVAEALETTKSTSKPLVLLADTVKGIGLSFMENIAGWHGKAPSRDEMMKGLKELGVADRIPVRELLEKA
jgi:transketolase